VHSAISLLPLSIKESNAVKWKLVMTPHFSVPGYSAVTRIIWKTVWMRHVARLLQHVDLLHATSQFEAGVLSSFFPNLKDRITVLSIGISSDVLAHKWRGQNADYLLYSGRLERYKRVDLVVNAVSHLVKNGHSLRLVISGSGTHRAGLARQATGELGRNAARFIAFKAPKSRDDYLELLSNARAAISLSGAENFNLFLAEAHMIGVPIVATKEAVAFCPSLANVGVLRPDQIANVILEAISEANTDRHICNLKTAREAADDLERAYVSLVNG
jgi:glycosyltransferase involved in cell wall biosynthesis